MAGFGVIDAVAGAGAAVRASRRAPTAARGARSGSGVSLLALLPARDPRLCGDGADLALGGGRSAQSVARGRDLLALLREALAGAVRRRADRRRPTCRAATCRRCSACKLPEVFACSGAARRGRLRCSPRSAPSIAPQRRAIHLAIALAALLPVAVTVIARPAMYNGIRHFVFVLPPLAVAGGLAGAWIAARLRASAVPAAAGLRVVFIAGIALPVVDMARLHPYEYAYFNHIGRRRARRAAALHARLLGARLQTGRRGTAREACRARRDAARRAAMEDRGLRPASAGAGRSATSTTWDSKGRLRADARCSTARLDAPLCRDRATACLRARLRLRGRTFRPCTQARGRRCIAASSGIRCSARSRRASARGAGSVRLHFSCSRTLAPRDSPGKNKRHSASSELASPSLILHAGPQHEILPLRTRGARRTAGLFGFRIAQSEQHRPCCRQRTSAASGSSRSAGARRGQHLAAQSCAQVAIVVARG